MLLKIEGLGIKIKTYRGIVNAVRQVSLEINEGEMVGLVGESGCGKSVTANAIIGLLPPDIAYADTGRIVFEGRDLLTQTEQEWQKMRGRDIAMVFQDPMTALNPVMTIGEQLFEAIKIHEPNNNPEPRAIELLAEVGIKEPERRLK